MGWEDVKTQRDALFNDVFAHLGAEERDILIDLLKLEADWRAHSAPRIKQPLRELVEAKIR